MTPIPHYMKVRVQTHECYGSAVVIDVRYGEVLADGSQFAPPPLCTILKGPDRTFAEVVKTADRIAFLWNASHEATEDMKRTKFLIGAEALAGLYFAELLRIFPFIAVADVEKFLAFMNKLISPAGHAYWKAEVRDGVRARIIDLIGAFQNNKYLTLKYAKQRHAAEAEAATQPTPKAS